MLWGLPKGLLGGMLEFWISLYKSYAKHFSKLCLSVAWSLLTRCSFAWSSEHYRAQKAVFFTYEVKEFKQFADNMIRSTVNEIKWTSLLARSLNLIAYISSSFPAHCSLGDWQVVLDKYFTSSSSHIVPLSGGGCISLVDRFKSKEKKGHTEKEKKSVLCNLKVSNREECQVGNSKEINDNKRFCDIAVVGSLCSIWNSRQ